MNDDDEVLDPRAIPVTEEQFHGNWFDPSRMGPKLLEASRAMLHSIEGRDSLQRVHVEAAMSAAEVQMKTIENLLTHWRRFGLISGNRSIRLTTLGRRWLNSEEAEPLTSEMPGSRYGPI